MWTKRQKGKKGYVERKVGKVFSVEGTWIMLQRRLMYSQSWHDSLWQQWQWSETKKDDRLLLHPIRRQNSLTAMGKNPDRDQAVNRKALWTRAKFHVDSNSFKNRHVNFGIFPCVWITGLNPDAHMATNADFDMSRQRKRPAKSQRKVVRKDQLHHWRSLHNLVVYLKILIREASSMWTR